jgi:hypothetical protein
MPPKRFTEQLEENRVLEFCVEFYSALHQGQEATVIKHICPVQISQNKFKNNA